MGREGGDWGTGIDTYMQAHACTFRHKTQRRHCQAQCTACLLVALSGCASACLPGALATATAAVAAAQTIYVGAHAHAHFFCILPTALTVSTVCPTVCLCVSSLERETKFIARAFDLPTSARRLNVAFARQFPPNPLLLLDSVTGIWPNARERRHKLGLWVNTQFPFPEIVRDKKLKHTFRRRL